MKKTLAIVALVLAVMFAFAACQPVATPVAPTAPDAPEAPAKPAEPVAAEPVKITILQFKVEIVDQLNAAIEAYKAVAPNVTITLETVGGGDDIGPVLKSRMQSNTLPTIYNVGGPSDIEIYIDYLEDLTAEPWVKTAGAGVLNNATADGKVYGLPYAIEGFGLAYNKEIFEAAGVDCSALNSFASIEAAMAKVDAAIKDGSLKAKYPMLEAVCEVPGAEKWVFGDHASCLPLGAEFNYDPFAAYGSKRPEWKYADAYQAYIDLQVKYSKWASNPKGSLAVTYGDEVSGGLALERVACIQQGNWIYGDIKNVDEAVAAKLDFMPTPIKGATEDSIFTLVPMYWCVSSKAVDAEKAAAKDFLNWLYQSEEGKKIVVEQFGFMPPFTNYGTMFPADPLAQAIKRYMEAGKILNAPFKGYPDGWSFNVLGAKIQGYLEGTLSFADALKQAADEWETSRK